MSGNNLFEIIFITIIIIIINIITIVTLLQLRNIGYIYFSFSLPLFT